MYPIPMPEMCYDDDDEKHTFDKEQPQYLSDRHKNKFTAVSFARTANFTSLFQAKIGTKLWRCSSVHTYKCTSCVNSEGDGKFWRQHILHMLDR